MARTFQLVNVFPGLMVAETLMVAVVSRLRRGHRGLTVLAHDREVQAQVEAVADLFGLADRLGRLARILPQGDTKLLDVASAFALHPPHHAGHEGDLRGPADLRLPHPARNGLCGRGGYRRAVRRGDQPGAQGAGSRGGSTRPPTASGPGWPTTSASATASAARASPAPAHRISRECLKARADQFVLEFASRELAELEMWKTYGDGRALGAGVVEGRR